MPAPSPRRPTAPHRSVVRTVAGCVAASAVAAACALATAGAAPAAPASDSQGYLDSTARCAAPATAVVFGSTESSRVAICATPNGGLQYRGVRVRDGARLITDASRTDDGAYSATSDGISYLVSSKGLLISRQEVVLRDEDMLDFHRPATSPGSSPGASPETPTTPSTSLPPPLPAEVGGNR
jgi:hypothetical protein